MPILTTSGLTLLKAGKKVDIAFRNVSGQEMLTAVISGAEAQLCSEARFDFINNLNSVSSQYRALLDDAASSKACIPLILYDMNQYTSRVEAESMINFHLENWNRILNLLRDKKPQDFIGARS